MLSRDAAGARQREGMTSLEKGRGDQLRADSQRKDRSRRPSEPVMPTGRTPDQGMRAEAIRAPRRPGPEPHSCLQTRPRPQKRRDRWLPRAPRKRGPQSRCCPSCWALLGQVPGKVSACRRRTADFTTWGFVIRRDAEGPEGAARLWGSRIPPCAPAPCSTTRRGASVPPATTSGRGWLRAGDSDVPTGSFSQARGGSSVLATQGVCAHLAKTTPPAQH